MTKSKVKQFDCIKMKNNIQAQVYTETKKMSKTELLFYFNQKVAATVRGMTIGTARIG